MDFKKYIKNNDYNRFLHVYYRYLLWLTLNRRVSVFDFSRSALSALKSVLSLVSCLLELCSSVSSSSIRVSLSDHRYDELWIRTWMWRISMTHLFPHSFPSKLYLLVSTILAYYVVLSLGSTMLKITQTQAQKKKMRKNLFNETTSLSISRIFSLPF